MSRESELEALRKHIEALERRLEAAFGGEREPDHNSELRAEIRALNGKVLQLWDAVLAQAEDLHALRQFLGGKTGGGPN